jgi:CDGSH-type Zn-finger protein
MPVKIRIKSNGSIKVEGDFELYDGEGNKFELNQRTAVSLCRCGKSAIMPFCDSTHRAIGFTSEVKARELPPPPAPKP